MDERKESSCIKIQGGVVRGATLELGNHDLPDVIYDRAFFQNCVLDICGAEFSIVDANFLNCQIKVRDKITNMRFLEAVFERCIFEGAYACCSFGHRRGESKTPNAYYRNCDFSKAMLDLCSFFEGDTDSVVWPTWPNFVVLNPRQNKQDWLSIQLPYELKDLQHVIAGDSNSFSEGDEDTNYDSISAPKAVTVDLAKYKEVDPDSIQSLIRNKTYIVWND